MPIILRILLWPFSVVYTLLTRLRNHLYDIGYKPSHVFETNLISVGNLSMGGTGKSPMVEYLIRALKPAHKIATLSRGYGRSTRGFRLAAPHDSARTLGDEPYQFYLKFGQEISVAVGEERALAIPQILHEVSPEIILLDDAYQHRSVNPSVNILLTEYHRPFYHDWVVPAGRLREARKGASRADMVVVTKCPQVLSEQEKEEVSRKVAMYAGAHTPVFFTRITYQQPVAMFPGTKEGNRVILFSGIAHSDAFELYVRSKYHVLTTLSFGDHHRYSLKDVEALKARYQQTGGKDVMLLTTEKDWVKLVEPSFLHVLQGVPVFYLPIEVEWIEGEHAFLELIKSRIKTYANS
jgi:tetraacyldisaccharide 4'-kinase